MWKLAKEIVGLVILITVGTCVYVCSQIDTSKTTTIDSTVVPIPQSSSCGSVTKEGYCEGNVMVWCPDDGIIRRIDCGTTRTCEVEIGYGATCNDKIVPQTADCNRMKSKLDECRLEVMCRCAGGPAFYINEIDYNLLDSKGVPIRCVNGPRGREFRHFANWGLENIWGQTIDSWNRMCSQHDEPHRFGCINKNDCANFAECMCMSNNDFEKLVFPSCQSPNHCAPNLTCCSDNKCVDLRSDKENCGSCGRICLSELSCVSGNCQLRIIETNHSANSNDARHSTKNRRQRSPSCTASDCMEQCQSAGNAESECRSATCYCTEASYEQPQRPGLVRDLNLNDPPLSRPIITNPKDCPHACPSVSQCTNGLRCQNGSCVMCSSSPPLS
jgi:hypothetical protein